MNFDPNMADAMMDMLKEPVGNLINPAFTESGLFLADALRYWYSNARKKFALKTISDQKEITMAGIAAQSDVEQFRAMIDPQKQELFVREILEYHSEIPEEEQRIPRKSMLFSTLDAAGYYVEEDELRRMFARKIAALCDERKMSKVHPSFAWIIQQLSPLDAQNLMCFVNDTENYPSGLPVAFYEHSFGSKNSIFPLDYTFSFFENSEEMDQELQNTSINSLSRLGLVEIEMNPIRYLPSHFEKFEKNRESLEAFYRLYRPDLNIYVKIKYAYIRRSSIGIDFCSVCLPPPPQEEDKE